MLLDKDKGHFESLPISQEIVYLYSIYENFEGNKDFQNIVLNSFKIVRMSKFTFDCLMHFIKKNNMILLEKFIFHSQKIKIQITNEALDG